MEIKTFPNSTRPGVGLQPKSESQRPFLPQHSRHCPVLEAGSSIGYLVYPPLESGEAIQINYQGEGRYGFGYFRTSPQGAMAPVFSITITLPTGGSGMLREDVELMTQSPAFSPQQACTMMRHFIVPEELGTPAGGVTLRGATNFRTPANWDSVYLPILNMIERPIAPMLVVRVETDWYAHESEFRYILQTGEGMALTHTLPVGQVVFLPREEYTLKECSKQELQEIKRSKEDFKSKKSASKLTTRYGVEYSPHYLRESRRHASGEFRNKGSPFVQEDSVE
jgi:hypothetical protein